MVKMVVGYVITIILLIVFWLIIKKFSNKFNLNIINKDDIKYSFFYLDQKNRIGAIEYKGKKYIVLFGQNNNILLDQSDV